MRFDTYTYLWPPRPEKAAPKMMLNFYAKQGFIGQIKKNGTCNVLAVSPERKLVCMNRHNETHKLWTPTAESSAAFKTLPGKGWYVFVAELLHSKVTNGPRDTNYVHDILVADGEYLVGQTLAERQQRLRDLFLKGGEAETHSHHVVDNHTWIAKNHTQGFGKLFDSLTLDEDEGLVLKNPKAPLTLCARQSANADWQVKVRRPHKNYGF